MRQRIEQLYGNRLRLRVVGLCWKDDRLLMVNHRGLHAGDFWAPPGGGVAFGVSAEAALRQEFHEETGLEIQVDRFQFACEFIQNPLHSMELFFACSEMGGTMVRGFDPEMRADEQLIADVKFLSVDEISALKAEEKHGIFRTLGSPEELRKARGFFKI